ncbi:class F sortase [Thermomicrobium sp. 4228-Ro]|uniref:class F sortase n=1 Tax=Thermomicrobium sp. 4228-Ro TaxID=2993937 RepID=UPI0022491D53|nr:class F sortase [Thermomicrobium sp. 4228-Ro]MCX2727796.1 class F sortase [Thermomicrobium sp. 4228-Ro]
MRQLVGLVVLAVASWLIGMGLGLAGASTLGDRYSRASAGAGTVVVRSSSTRTSVVGPTSTSSTRTAEAAVTPTTAASESRIVALRIPAIGVEAPVVAKGLDASRRMEAPDRPEEVAWYDFTALPGAGSNVVLAGHVDFAGVGPAVFWDLWRVRVGDIVELELADGRVARYRVSGLETVEEATAPVERIVGPTPAERLTLITCAGNYNPATGRYDQRLIVVAVPLEQSRR